MTAQTLALVPAQTDAPVAAPRACAKCASTDLPARCRVCEACLVKKGAAKAVESTKRSLESGGMPAAVAGPLAKALTPKAPRKPRAKKPANGTAGPKALSDLLSF